MEGKGCPKCPAHPLWNVVGPSTVAVNGVYLASRRETEKYYPLLARKANRDECGQSYVCGFWARGLRMANKGLFCSGGHLREWLGSHTHLYTHKPTHFAYFRPVRLPVGYFDLIGFDSSNHAAATSALHPCARTLWRSHSNAKLRDLPAKTPQFCYYCANSTFYPDLDIFASGR